MKLKKTETDDAVSPVVGVMLMLVVTILVAAVVTTFATGLTSETTPTPQAVFSVEYDAFEHAFSKTAVITWTHKGGDTLDPNSVELILEEYGQVTKCSIGDDKGILTASPIGGIGVGSKIVLDGTKMSSTMLYGQTTWSFIDKNTGNKIATGSFFIS